MSDDRHNSTLVNFIRTQQPQFVYEIPETDLAGNDIDASDLSALALLDPETAFEKIRFSEMDVGGLQSVDENFDVGGLVIISDDGRYLIPYSPTKE
ncbi:hypothetical protein [Deinococcus marmoris]|uniref:hypothetical protein n=1 Tax=Deinococcus marmoris TaxID=249408 RepID=UPI0004953E69|nr:hypothetical protein [Deinococcus marmoris]